MPYAELIDFLRSQGDAVEWFQSERQGASLRTVRGLEYVCSSQGLIFEGYGWKTRWTWHKV